MKIMKAENGEPLSGINPLSKDFYRSPLNDEAEAVERLRKDCKSFIPM